MTTCELRKAAAKVIEERGWGRGMYLNPESGCCCLIGSLVIAAGGTVAPDGMLDWSSSSDEALHEALSALDFDGEAQAVTWNDHRGRTQAQVIARLVDGCEE